LEFKLRLATDKLKLELQQITNAGPREVQMILSQGIDVLRNPSIVRRRFRFAGRAVRWSANLVQDDPYER
jgi:hypothetical protein